MKDKLKRDNVFYNYMIYYLMFINLFILIYIFVINNDVLVSEMEM